MVLSCSRGRGRIAVNTTGYEVGPGSLFFLPWDRSIRYEADLVEPFLLSAVHIVPWHDPEAQLLFSVPHWRSHPRFDSPSRTSRTEAAIATRQAHGPTCSSRS